MEKAVIYAKIWKTGSNTDVITIRRDIMKLMSLKRGETVQITINKMQNTPKQGEEEEKEPETQEQEKKALITKKRE